MDNNMVTEESYKKIIKQNISNNKVNTIITNENKLSDSSSNKDPIVTSTLGEIYAAQGHFAKAIGVYDILQKKNPDNPVYKQKIEELTKKQEEAEQKD